MLGGLALAGGYVWALIERVMRHDAEKLSRSLVELRARDKETIMVGGDILRAQGIDAAQAKIRAKASDAALRAEIERLTNDRDKLARILVTIDPHAAALATGTVLDGVLQRSPGEPARAPGGGDSPVRTPGAAAATTPGKGV